jgi:hypothetical protein
VAKETFVGTTPSRSIPWWRTTKGIIGLAVVAVVVLVVVVVGAVEGSKNGKKNIALGPSSSASASASAPAPAGETQQVNSADPSVSSASAAAASVASQLANLTIQGNAPQTVPVSGGDGSSSHNRTKLSF